LNYMYAEVIEIANRAGKQDDLVRYLQMAWKTLREPRIDTELAYSYAKTDRSHDMEDFLGFTNVADILDVGEKCFNDELYQASKLLFTSISNWARLATTLIYLSENQAAVESARKAGNTEYVIRLGMRSQVTENVSAECGSKSTACVFKKRSSAWYVGTSYSVAMCSAPEPRRHKSVVLTSLSMRYVVQRLWRFPACLIISQFFNAGGTPCDHHHVREAWIFRQGSVFAGGWFEP
jgi:hypothetical protein